MLLNQAPPSKKQHTKKDLFNKKHKLTRVNMTKATYIDKNSYPKTKEAERHGHTKATF
jgi:hypothetical protein